MTRGDAEKILLEGARFGQDAVEAMLETAEETGGVTLRAKSGIRWTVDADGDEWSVSAS